MSGSHSLEWDRTIGFPWAGSHLFDTKGQTPLGAVMVEISPVVRRSICPFSIRSRESSQLPVGVVIGVDE